MADEIQVGDFVYISSKRASEISGYAQDYIGHLARKGFIEAKRVGGLWYLKMESLETYRASPPSVNEHKRETVQIQDEADVLVTFDGKDYISANRASKITGYNQDYIGQLARGGKVLSRQVGNRWYIDRDGILEHKKEKDGLLAAVQAQAVGIPRPIDKRPLEIIEQTNTAQTLIYQTEQGDLQPRIERYDREERVLRLRQEREPDENRKEESLADPKPGEEDHIPVHVVRREPSYNEGLKAIKLSYVRPKRIKEKRPIKRLYKIYIMTIGVLIAVGCLYGLYVNFKAIGGISSKSIAENISSLGRNAGIEIIAIVEHIVSTELVYQRQN